MTEAATASDLEADAAVVLRVGRTGRPRCLTVNSIGSLGALRADSRCGAPRTGDMVRINCAHLSFIDSAALAELLRYQLQAAVQHRQVLLEDASLLSPRCSTFWTSVISSWRRTISDLDMHS